MQLPNKEQDGEFLVGTERYNLSRFIKDFHIFRYPELTSKIIRIPPNIQLPWNSVLHVMDNFQRENQSDIPNMNDPFIANEDYRKYVYHAMQPDLSPDSPITKQLIINDKIKEKEDGEPATESYIPTIHERQLGEPTVIEDIRLHALESMSTEEITQLQLNTRYFYRPINLNKNIQAFRRFHPKTKPLFRLEDIPASQNTLSVINHNPVFRIATIGQLKNYRRFNLIMSSILNTACKIHNKNQYFLIPFSDRVYSRMEFTRSHSKFNMNTIKHPDDFHYLFLMNWINFLDTTTELSLFSAIPEDRWSEFTFIFKVNNHCIIQTLSDIKKLNDNNKAYLKIINQLNALAIAGREDGTVLDITTAENEEPKVMDQDDVPEENKIVPTEHFEISPSSDQLSLFNQMKALFKLKYGWNVDKLKLYSSNECRFEDGGIDKKRNPLECAGAWTDKGIIYVGTREHLRKVYKKYNKEPIRQPEDAAILEFERKVIVHEMAHEVYARILNDKDKENYRNLIIREGFTTEYLNTISKSDKQKYDKEAFCEYIACHIYSSETATSSDSEDDAIDKEMEKVIDKKEADAKLIRNVQSTNPVTKTIDETKSVFHHYLSPVIASATKNKASEDEIIIDETVTETELDTGNIEIEPTHPTQIAMKPKDPHRTEKDVADYGKRHLDELDNKALEAIEKKPDLTPRQKQRYIAMSQVYKNLEIGGKTFEEHIAAPVNPKPDSNNLDFLTEHLPDPSMANSSIISHDTSYMERYFHKDLCSVAASFHSSGMFLTDIEEEHHADELNSISSYTMRYEDLNGKRHSVKIQIPKIDEKGQCLVNGVRYYMKKQMVNVPICKISPSRVSLISNYNKTLVERNMSLAHSYFPYIQKYISKINENEKRIIMEYGNGFVNIHGLPYEYTNISRTYIHMKIVSNIKKIEWTFNYKHRWEGIPTNHLDILQKLESELGVYLGKTIGVEGEYHFMTLDGIVVIYNVLKKATVGKSTIIDIFATLFPDITMSSRLTEWVDLKILDKKLPIGFILAYRFGLDSLLSALKVKHRLDPVRTRVPRRNSDIVIPFKDKVITLPRYPLKHSLIFTGLLMFNTKNYLYEDMDTDDAYYGMLMEKGLSINYLKGIDSAFELFIDPITKDVLSQMNEPTNFRDLLIRATEMLTVEHHSEPASMSNHRLRTYERLNAIVYNEMSRAHASFKSKTGKGNTFSLNPNAVIQRILQDQAMMVIDEINPIQDIKDRTNFTYTGIGGRTAEAFVIEDRKFPKDAVGIISEATVDNSSVAINAATSVNPALANVRGILDQTNMDELKPVDILSATSMLMPCAPQDDQLTVPLASNS